MPETGSPSMGILKIVSAIVIFPDEIELIEIANPNITDGEIEVQKLDALPFDDFKG